MGTVVRGGPAFRRQASRPANRRYARVIGKDCSAPKTGLRDVLAALAVGSATCAVLMALGTPVWIGLLTASVVGFALLATPHDDVVSSAGCGEPGIPRIA